MPTPKEIKIVKAANAKFERAKELRKELAELEAELAEYGLTLPKETAKATTGKKTRAARKSYPEITPETVKALIKERGGKIGAGDLQAHFGVKFQAWRKTHEKAFTITKDGVSKTWENK